MRPCVLTVERPALSCVSCSAHVGLAVLEPRPTTLSRATTSPCGRASRSACLLRSAELCAGARSTRGHEFISHQRACVAPPSAGHEVPSLRVPEPPQSALTYHAAYRAHRTVRRASMRASKSRVVLRLGKGELKGRAHVCMCSRMCDPSSPSLIAERWEGRSGRVWSNYGPAVGWECPIALETASSAGLPAAARTNRAPFRARERSARPAAVRREGQGLSVRVRGAGRVSAPRQARATTAIPPQAL